MKALVLNEFNSPFNLKEIPVPLTTADEVLIRIVASGVNPFDLKIKAGQGAHAQVKIPAAVLGTDMSGIIESVGTSVKDFSVGDEVFGMVGGIAGMQGTLAEFVAADPALLALKPSGLSFKEAASLPLNAITAWEALIDRAAIKKGHTVLIHGGAGGVGCLAIQLARAIGADVYSTASTDQQDAVSALGALAIDYTQLSVEDYVKKYTGGKGFDIVLDTVGGLVLDASFKAVKRNTGRVVSIMGWDSHSLAPLSFLGASYSGVFTHYPLLSGIGRRHHGQILSDIALLISSGKLRPIVDTRRFCLESIEEAYQSVENNRGNGKIVVSVSENEAEENHH